MLYILILVLAGLGAALFMKKESEAKNASMRRLSDVRIAATVRRAEAKKRKQGRLKRYNRG